MSSYFFLVFNIFSFQRPYALENVRSATVKRHNELASVLLDNRKACGTNLYSDKCSSASAAPEMSHRLFQAGQAEGKHGEELPDKRYGIAVIPE